MLTITGTQAHDFDAGAMENWGLITGRTYGFLLDSDRADIASKKRVVGYQGHEVAHMWFGNITTPEWWDNLYLNEGAFNLFGFSETNSDVESDLLGFATLV